MSKRLKRTMLSKVTIATAIFLIYYIFSFTFIGNYLNHEASNVYHIFNKISFKYDLIRPQFNKSYRGWISYNSYAAIPYFYKKLGSPVTPELITVTSICDIDLLYEARNIASNYHTGPLSFAVYIDQDYLALNPPQLYEKIENTFRNISHNYDISVAIVAINHSSQFYNFTAKARLFDADTPLMFKIPTNVLRNLAEYQVETNWILNIDIDFWFMSHTLNDESNIQSLLLRLNTMVSSQKWGMKTVFVIPAFEIILETDTIYFEYNSLTKRQLTDLVFLEEIEPFHNGMNAQKCTNYNVWYDANKEYRIKNCHYAYEPWFIIHRNVSTFPMYQWDHSYIGRGLNKVERIYKLRHYCFNFLVMHDLFMIHAPDSMVIHHTIVTDAQKLKWHEYNWNLFNVHIDAYRKDELSCVKRINRMIDSNKERKEMIALRGKGNDLFCENGIVSNKMNGNKCKVCCPKQCEQCGGRGCGKINPYCCLSNIFRSQRYCNTSNAPCQLTVTQYCAVDEANVEFV